MQRVWCLAIGGLLWSGVLWAQEPISARLFLRPAEHVLQAGTSAYWVERPFLEAVVTVPAQELRLRDFPLGQDETGTVRLRRARSVVDGQTQWWRGVRPARGGEPEVLLPMPGITQYVFDGDIEGEPGSRVLLSVTAGQLYGLIRRGDGRWLEFVPTGQRWNGNDEHVLSTVQGQGQWLCAVEQTQEYWEWLRTAKETVPPHPLAPTLRQARVALETTSSLYTRLNRDYDRVAAYVAALFAMASRIYEDEVNVTFVLPWVLIWMAPPDGEEDPYRNDNDIRAMLSEVTQYWNQNRRSVERDLVHVMTAPGGTMVGGIAQLNSLCNSSRAYSISGIRGDSTYPTLSYTWDVHVVTHEIGHVFGAPHTHACYWNPPLDTCVTQDNLLYPTSDACYSSPIQPRPAADGGSIMSYCHLVQDSVVLTFRERVATVIRNSRAEGCLSTPPTPKLLLQYPVGRQTLAGGQPVEIRWTSWQVQQINIEYSVDSMQTWRRIATGVAAVDRRYQWRLPFENIPSLWLRIYDVTNPTVADTTMASLTVQVPTLTLTSPKGGERYGYRERIPIEWTATLVPAVHLLFSSDGGGRWDTVARAVTGSPYTWQAPQIATQQALIRVQDTAGAVADQSQPFAIGAPVLQLLVPNGGERWTVGSQQEIRWYSDFVNRIRIEYSTDGGQSWRAIRVSYDAKQQSYLWTVPNTPTERAVVRLRNLADTSQTVRSAAPFTIEAGTVGVEETAGHGVGHIGLSRAMLEGGWLWLAVRVEGEHRMVSLHLVNVLGQIVQEQSLGQLPAGEQVLRLALPAGVADGFYVLEVRSERGHWAFPLRLVR